MHALQVAVTRCTVRRTTAELRQMSRAYYAGTDVTAHLSSMGMTIVAGQHGPRFAGR